MPRNESPENTIMKDAPPGDESGIYYIMISGLPFGTIWQLLKDWLRQAGCDVDHIEVFQRSTSGWIRLIGKENFERALHHLQRVPYNNRLLLYLDKNRTESVKIMELIDDPPPKPKLGGSARGFRFKGKTPTQHKTTPSDQHVQEKSCSQVMTSQVARIPGADTAPTMCYHGLPAEAPCMGGWNVQHGSAYIPDYRLLEQAASHASSSTAPSNCRHGCLNPVGSRSLSWAGSITPPCDASQKESHVDKEQRCKVLLLSLKHGASPRDVEEWVRSSMGEWASAMSRIEVPVDQQSGRIRGSGYALFFSSAAAQRAVEVLNQKLFLGRLVYARLADEGKKNKGQGALGRRCDAGSSGRQLENKGSASAQQEAGNKVDTKHRPPVIAHGTFYRPKCQRESTVG